jgi:hypothetical protein
MRDITGSQMQRFELKSRPGRNTNCSWLIRPLLRQPRSTLGQHWVEAVINEDEKIAEQLGEELHGSPPKTHQAWTGQAHG